MTSLSILRSSRTILVVAAATAMLSFAACSNGSSERSASMLPSAEVPADLLNLAPFERRMHHDSVPTKDLFVGLFGDPQSYVRYYQNGTFKYLGEIDVGYVTFLQDSWVDSHGLYLVARPLYGAYNIVEYTSLKSKPFIYNAGMINPVAVTTDSVGDVFEGDAGNNTFYGQVIEYPQKQNSIKHSCDITGHVWGVAVDAFGDVFYAYTVAYTSAPAYIGEFTDFNTCSSTTFGVTLGQIGNMVLDKSSNILVIVSPNVDIIKPPYSKVSGHLGKGFSNPVDVTINSANNRAWVTDNVTPTSAVYDLIYPSGKQVGKIKIYYSSGYRANTAVDGSNFVP